MATTTTAEAIPRQVWGFWFGGSMQGSRLSSKKALSSQLKVPFVLVTEANLAKYVLPEHPLHPTFGNLTGVHKSVRAALLCESSAMHLLDRRRGL